MDQLSNDRTKYNDPILCIHFRQNALVFYVCYKMYLPKNKMDPDPIAVHRKTDVHLYTSFIGVQEYLNYYLPTIYKTLLIKKSNNHHTQPHDM